MTDRELLEMAARAAGITLDWFEPTSKHGDAVAQIGDEYWDPLTDDGDALRLAVATGLSVHTARPGSKDSTVAVEWVSPVAGGDGVWVDEPIGSDRNHDTRRAIVRAAAEIQIQKERNEQRS